MKYLKGMIIKGYNRLIRQEWLNRNHKLCRRLRAVFIHNICREMKVSFGKKNPDKLFYVIRDPKGEHGLFALYNFVMFHLKIAQQRKAVPIVDVQYYPLEGLIEDHKVGKENAWEYFFEQVSPYTLEEVYQSRNVIMAAGIDAASLSAVYDEETLQKERRLSAEYIRIRPDILSVCERQYHELGFDHKRVLGVICRGTDFISARPQGHSIVPTAQDTIEVIDEKSREWGGYDAVYLATEDKDIFRIMTEYYGRKLISYQKIRLDKTDGAYLCSQIEEIALQNTHKSFKKNLMTEYLISIWLLSKCNALIAPVIGSTLGVMCIGKGFEHCHLIQLGNYGSGTNES